MSSRMISIFVNEQKRSVPENLSLKQLRDQEKPDDDVLVVNSFPAVVNLLIDSEKVMTQIPNILE